MKRIEYLRYGGPEELRLGEVATPVPGQGQIRAQVRAAAANPMDWKIRAAWVTISPAWSKPLGQG